MLDFNTAYKVDGYEGIAWHLLRHPLVTDECPGHPAGEYDDLGETVYCDGSCVEPYPDEDRVICRMVGDDADYDFGVDEITPLDDDEWCAGCGQIGCGHDGRSGSDV